MKNSRPPRAPTLEDVARTAGLSPMTVSRALNSLQLVRPKTVEKVMQAVADYLLKKGYRRHGIAADAHHHS